MAEKIGQSLLWDDKAGDIMLISGRPVLAEDELSVLEWLNCNLNVELDAFDIYTDTGIGIPTRELIGAKGSVPRGTIFAVLQSAVEQTCLLCKAVERVTDMLVGQSGAKVTMGIELKTVYGDLQEVAQYGLD